MRTASHVAMDFLARREHPRAELFLKLQGRDFSDEEINAVLDQLAAENLQSDERFCEAFIHHRSQKGMGPIRIEQELLAHGVSRELIAAILDDRDPEWISMARAVREKKFGSEIPKTFSDIAKQKNFLIYRGFSSRQVEGVFDVE